VSFGSALTGSRFKLIIVTNEDLIGWSEDDSFEYIKNVIKTRLLNKESKFLIHNDYGVFE
jgi:hypothetical protein